MNELFLELRIAPLIERIASDPEYQAASASLDLKLDFRCEASVVRLHVIAGSLTMSSAETPPDIELRATQEVWRKVLTRLPSPGFQSLTALQRCREDFTVVCDPLIWAQSLHVMERIFELLREEPAEQCTQSAIQRDAQLIEGHYHDIRIPDGRESRIYYEKSGRGPPILMLHTAGADSRQFHDLLTDVELSTQWTMYAFDLPSHGRSFPIVGDEGKPWRLTQADYAEWCASFIEDVIGEPAVVMGCSMGAAIAVVLTTTHPRWLTAVVALEAPDRSPGRRNAYLSHAKVNQSEYVPSYVRGLMSPASPTRNRKIACWIYGQGGYGVYSADLAFYSDEYDGTALAPHVDTIRTPLYLLTGEYDYSASPAATQRLANAIQGAVFKVMPGLGHFPMTENPDEFRKHLLPVLKAITASSQEMKKSQG